MDHSMLSTGVHFVNVKLGTPWNSMLWRILRIHGIATFTSMLMSTFHSMICLDPVDVCHSVVNFLVAPTDAMCS